MFDRDQQRITTALALVGEGEGYEARIVSLKLAEHRANVRGIGIDVRDHDDHIPGPQQRIGAEAREQLIVQDLHFALSAVGNVEADRRVFLQVHGRPAFTGFAQRTQLKDVVLQLVEHVQRLAVTEQVDAPVTKRRAIAVGIVVAVEQVDVVPPLFAPCRQ
ncbi:hypothetical protein D9M71_448720 [compost metagenome]